MADPVEVMARVMFHVANGYDTDMSPPFNPKSKVGMAWTSAAAALSALDAAGFAVVPKEPTEAMLEAGANKYDGDMNKQERAYRAMLSAAQVKP